jgi:hypothetical protein
VRNSDQDAVCLKLLINKSDVLTLKDSQSGIEINDLFVDRQGGPTLDPSGMAQSTLEKLNTALDLSCILVMPLSPEYLEEGGEMASSETYAPYITPSDGTCYYNPRAMSTCAATNADARRICRCMCPENHFGSAGVCEACPTGSLSPAGSRYASDCLCAPGFYGMITSSSDSCVACQDGSAVDPFNSSDVFQAGGGVLGWQGSNVVTSCGTTGFNTFKDRAVLGGFNKLSRTSHLRKTFSGLCTHNRIAIGFGFVAIDAWAGETAMLYVDGALVWIRSFSNPDFGSSCGASQADVEVEVDLVVSHSQNQMTVEFRTSLGAKKDVGDPQATGSHVSWGISYFVASALCSGQVLGSIRLLPLSRTQSRAITE